MVTCPKVHGPVTTVGEIRALSDDEHVRLALMVTVQQRLVTTITTALDTVTELLRTTRRRRLAVTDDADRLLGLLCLKRDENGFCSDVGIRARAAGRGYK